MNQQLPKQDSQQLAGKLKIGFWILTSAVAIFQAWAYRFYIYTDDGISYLDIADSYLAGDWHAALNSMWSPLYSWILAAFIAVFHPSPYWEFGMMKIVNLLIFFFQLISFNILLNEVVSLYQRQKGYFDEKKLYLIPEWWWIVAGYSFFIFATLTSLSSVCVDCPDGLMHACAYLAIYYLLRTMRDSSVWNYLKLGMYLGIGFLSKAFLFGWSFVIFFLAIFSGENIRKSVPRVLAACAVFAIIVTPFICALSAKLHRFSYSDGGSFHLAFNVYRSADYSTLKAIHPYEVLEKDPLVWGFGGVYDTATFPPWFDRIYWTEGYKVIFNLQNQIVVAIVNMYYYWSLFLGVIIVGYFALLLIIGKPCFSIFRVNFPLLVPPLAGLAMYAIATNLLINDSPRYFSSLYLLLTISLLFHLNVPDTKRGKIGLGAMLVIMIGAYTFTGLGQLKTDLKQFGESAKGNRYWDIAEGLEQNGLKQNDRIMLVGCGKVYWARLARLKCVGYLPDIDQFWREYPADMPRVDAALKKYGVKALIIPPEFAAKRDMKDAADFKRVKDSDCYVHVL